LKKTLLFVHDYKQKLKNNLITIQHASCQSSGDISSSSSSTCNPSSAGVKYNARLQSCMRQHMSWFLLTVRH